MPQKALATGVIMVMLMIFTVYVMEFFLPLSVKSQMNSYCRAVLIKMEAEGGLSQEERNNLYEKLMGVGFTNINVEAAGALRLGDYMNLSVHALYPYKKLTGLFTRSEAFVPMKYERVMVLRKVVN